MRVCDWIYRNQVPNFTLFLTKIVSKLKKNRSNKLILSCETMINVCNTSNPCYPDGTANTTSVLNDCICNCKPSYTGKFFYEIFTTKFHCEYSLS